MSKGNYITADRIFTSPQLAIAQLKKQLGITLILAPHPDDEALGCGGLIQHLLKQNAVVLICFMTSGGASHPNSLKYPPEVMTKIREKEAIKACKILGVDSNNIIFLRGPDSSLMDLEDDKKICIASKLADLLKQFNISSLFLPWRRDAHPDHKATYELGKKSVEMTNQDIQIVEYPIWLWKNSQEKDWPIIGEVKIFRLEISEMLPNKRKAIFAHKSQTTSFIDDDSDGFLLTTDLLSPFLKPYEYFFFDSNKKAESLEKKYFDTLYSENTDPWNFRNSDYENLKYEKINTFLKNKNFLNGLELGCSIGIHTTFLAEHCENLLSVDISEKAIQTAKELNSHLENVRFKTLDILHHFPEGPFEFISMCEIGYYFDEEKLKLLYKKIKENLTANGYLLMVHWSPFVREYPLTGKQVRELFESSVQNKHFTMVSFYENEFYELILWKKDN